MNETKQCGSCGAAILWTKTANGNWMPLDANPVPGGNVVLINGVSHTLKGELFDEMIEKDTPRYQSHFASCPNAAKHRKAK